MKKIIILLAIMSMFLMSINFSIAALSCAIIEPDSGDTLVDGSILNVSFTGEGDENSTMSVIYTFISTSTANSTAGTGTFIAVINLSGADLMADGSINFSLGTADVLEDSNDYAITATVNETTCTGVATDVIVDRTSPSTPTTTQAATSVLKDGDVITYTVTGIDTTTCRISFQTSKVQRSSGTNTFAMVHTGNDCTYTIPSITIGDGVYSMRAWASDGTNSSFSAPLDIEIDNIASNTLGIGDGVKVGIGEAVGEKIKGDQIATIVGVIVLLYLIFRRKGRT